MVPGYVVDFEHDELPGFDVQGDRLGSRDDVGQIRFEVLGQWRRHADDDCVGIGKPREICRCDEFPATDHVGNAFVGDVLDVAPAGCQRIDLGLVDVDPESKKASGIKAQDKREADIAKADHGDADGAALDLAKEIQAVPSRRPTLELSRMFVHAPKVFLSAG